MRAQDPAGCSLALQASCVLLTWDREEDRGDGIPSFCRMHPAREGVESGSVHHLPSIKALLKTEKPQRTGRFCAKYGIFLDSCEG